MATKKKKEEVPLHLENFGGTKMEQLHTLYQKWHGCKKCVLSDFRTDADGNPFDEITFGDGNADTAQVLIVGEAPGEEEERTGVPFVGPSGKLLNQILAHVSDDTGIQDLSKWYDKASRTKDNIQQFHETVTEWRRKDFFMTNVVACRPPENRSPTNVEVKACYERLYNIVYIVDPLVIIAVGKTAIEALVRKTTEITKVRGNIFEIPLPGRVGPVFYPVIPVLHPSFLLRVADWKEENGFYAKTVQDFITAMRTLDFLRNTHFGVPYPQRAAR